MKDDPLHRMAPQLNLRPAPDAAASMTSDDTATPHLIKRVFTDFSLFTSLWIREIPRGEAIGPRRRELEPLFSGQDLV